MQYMRFEHELIKGRIAETIFEMMFRKTGKFTVLRFGYESTVPNLAQYGRSVHVQEVIDQVRKSPDFVLITENKEQTYFVEVKYRARINTQELAETATGIAERWELSYLFVVSNDGFYFSPVRRVINNCGKIERLSVKWIPDAIQKKFFALVQDFLTHHTNH